LFGVDEQAGNARRFDKKVSKIVLKGFDDGILYGFEYAVEQEAALLVGLVVSVLFDYNAI
jgi:hypothetical protein